MAGQNGGARGEPLLRNVSDTARAMAMGRAVESERPDALFKDPYARRLAGPRGEQLVTEMKMAGRNDWGLASRTVLLDDIVRRAVKEGVDTVLNLAAGLDSRPYRMGDLPATLRWIEVDLPGIIDEKEQVLAGEKPVCRLERMRLDLANAAERRTLFERLGREAGRVLVLTEGLLMYLQQADVEGLARDLAAQPGFQLWALDLLSPEVIRYVNKLWQKMDEASEVRMTFGPSEGVNFFEPRGWKAAEVRSLLQEAARAGRLGLSMRLMLWISSLRRGANNPLATICLLRRAH